MDKGAGHTAPADQAGPVYATTGPAAWALAYELGTLLAHSGPDGDGRRSVLVVDAAGHVKGGEGEEGGDLGPDFPALLRDSGRSLNVLAYPEEEGAEANGSAPRRTLERLGSRFEAIVVCCGSSPYGMQWLAAADGVAICGAPGRELQQMIEATTTRLSEQDPQQYAAPAVILAPIGDEAPEEELPYPAYPLPPAKESADFRPALGPLLEGLFEATGRRPAAPGTAPQTGEGRDAPSEIAGALARSVSEPRAGAGPQSRPEARHGRGGGEAAVEERHPEVRQSSSLEELENRLRLALRETTLGGFARVCVGSPKGGVGKSSIAYAVAGSIASHTNLRTCLVDADPNFGSTRLLVPRPVEHSVVTLAEAADEIGSLSELRQYVAQNEQMRLDVVLGPEQAHEITRLEDLGEAYGRIDEVLSRYYDLVVYDLGLGFRDPAIRRVLGLSNELVFVSDSEIIPNAMLADAIQYVANLGVDLGRTTLVLNHRLPRNDESAAATQVRTAHESSLRRVTEVPYDARMSQMLNRRAFHVEELGAPTRLGVLTTVAACLEGLREATAAEARQPRSGRDGTWGMSLPAEDEKVVPATSAVRKVQKGTRRDSKRGDGNAT